MQGMLLDSPELRGIVVYGLGAGNVTLRDGSGRVFEDQERMNDEGNVAVYILPAGEQFTLEVASDRAFDIGVYEAGDDDTSRRTLRHEVQAEAGLTGSMAIGSTSDYDLELDYDGTGYVKTNSTIGTCTTNTDVRGTDSAALAAVCTETRLAELDAGNLPTDVSAIPTTAMRGTDSAALVTD